MVDSVQMDDSGQLPPPNLTQKSYHHLELMMSSGIGFPAAVGIVLAVLYLGLHLLLRRTQHRSEPPVIESALPFITPIIGLNKHTYFADLK